VLNSVVPNQRAEGMSYIGAWCPDELVGAIEKWISREKKKRRVNRTDFLLEAAKEKLVLEKIPVADEGSSAFRSGHQRKANTPNSKSTSDATKLLRKAAASEPGRLPKSQPKQ
jgi:hypothetical protein